MLRVMGLPFFSGGTKKRDQVVAIDLGSRMTKAVQLQRDGASFKFTGFTLLDSPSVDKLPAPEALSEHLKKVMEAVGARSRQISLVLGVGDSLLRYADMPAVAPSELRMMLKFGSKNYLQQDLKDYLFDCHLFVPRPEPGKPVELLKPNSKARVLIGGARKQLVDDLQQAARLAGLSADAVTTSFIGPPNAFESAMPEVNSKEVIALVDIGYKNTTINILQSGDLMLSRVVAIGAARITTGIAETLGISENEAESAKVQASPDLEPAMPIVLSPLGRELRASIDFFDHQKDKTVSQVFFSGGSARNNQIIQALQVELMVPCQGWNPTANLGIELPPQQRADLDQVAPQLTVALGAALAAF